MTKSLKLDQQLSEKVFKSFKKTSKVSPLFSLKVGALYKGKKVFEGSYGKNYKYYDLASMTKAMFTATYFYHRQDLLKLPVSNFLPWLYMSSLKIKDLLNHSSGLAGYKEFYKPLNKLPIDERGAALKRFLRAEVEKISKNKKSNQPVYSDIGYLILGLLIEELEGESLDQVFERENKVLGLHFNVKKPKYKKSLYAPTEKCVWRKKTLQGEVFDDNTEVLGGVAAHAGLFGTVEGMLSYGKTLIGMHKKNPGYFKRVNREFSNGFMIPSGNETTAGACFSKKSIGHLGFTGVSFWYDPEVDLFVTILANRTYPNRKDFSFNKYRPLIQDLVYKNFVGSL